jgi:hypothetical protein
MSETRGFEGTAHSVALKKLRQGLHFDQYGTVVDMQSGLTEAAVPTLRPKLPPRLEFRGKPRGIPFDS